jgi:LuxR family maltose regulon positive regulatory protein
MLNAYLEIPRANLPPSSASRRSLGSSDLAVDTLTQREEEVLELMRWGLSNNEIARKLDININTVKSHSKNLFSKLSVKSRTQAVLKRLN